MSKDEFRKEGFIMKNGFQRWLAFLAAVLTILVLISCSSSKTKQTSEISCSDTSSAYPASRGLSEGNDTTAGITPDEKEDPHLELNSNVISKSKTNSATASKTIPEPGKTGGKADLMPYKNIFSGDPVKIQVNDGIDPLKSCIVSYKKREGGTYIYSNNPEKLADPDVNQAILQEKSMSGMYEFTFEHSNHSGGDLYLGYQLLNTGKTDACVTVYNIGLQVDGEWLGQRSWSDFYNCRFELPEDYFEADGSVSWIYDGVDFIDYTPRIFHPTTYRIPAGQYLYVLGGTSADAVNRTNVANTANQVLRKGKCANGAVKFNVTGGKITGTFYAYNNITEAMKSKEQGYVTLRDGIDYSKQYKGTDPHLGVIDADLSWTVNDKTVSGNIPVTYQTSYDKRAQSNMTTPYRTYNNSLRTLNRWSWTSALNPQTSNNAIGTDMMVFHCVDTNGTARVIDNDHADGSGEPANTGNWMVQYNDNYTLINSGTKPRTFHIYTQGSVSGALMTAVRDKDGKVLEARLKAQPYSYQTLPAGANPAHYRLVNGTWWPMVDGTPFCETARRRALVWTITVQPRSYEQFTVDYLIMGNSCGSVEHWVVLD